ncbi:AraC family transcriptional regulator [Bacillus paramycoides]|uniref:AraC family transcriptional regulator n=1 Tax=Bacillus paramycoides TaxID=2026194 RepID=UPI003CFED0FE
MNRKLIIISQDENVINFIKEHKEIYRLLVTLHIYDSLEEFFEEMKDSLDYILFIDFDQFTVTEETCVIEKIHHISHQTIILKTEFTSNQMRKYLKLGFYDCMNKMSIKKEFYPLFSNLVCGNTAGPSNNKYTSAVKIELAYDLIFGNIKNAKEIWDKSKVINLFIVPNTALIIHIDDFLILTKNKSKMWEYFVRQEIRESVVSFFENKFEETLVISTAPEKFTVLLSLPVYENKQEYVRVTKKYAKSLKEFVWKNTGSTITIGIGNYYEDARNLYVSYQEALTALSQKFFYNHDTCIHIEEVHPFKNELHLLSNEKILFIIDKLMIGDFLWIKQHMPDITNALFIEQSIPPELFKFNIINFLLNLINASIKNNIPSEKIYAVYKEELKKMNTLETIQQFKKWFQHVLNVFLEIILSDQNKYQIKIVESAVQYLEDHYFENITLEQVANEIHLNASYFSHVFKKTTGFSFIEYLSLLRIEKAKIMLADLKYTIYHIANLVGYNDARYFSKVFKSRMGITPTAYRNTLLTTTRK